MVTLRWLGLLLLLSIVLPCAALAQEAKSPATTKATGEYRPWPHTFDINGQHLVIHQPQLDSWNHNQLSGRAAVAVKTGQQAGSDGKQHDVFTYGVMWFTARTEVDKSQQEVTLTNVTVDKTSFPADPSHQAQYQAALTSIASRSNQVIDLVTLEASLAIGRQESAVKNVVVRNDPPEIIFSFGPALLVLIDGQPSIKPTSVSGVSRVINTRSLLLKQGSEFYLKFAGQWVRATSLDGPWTVTSAPSPAVTKAGLAAVDAHQVDTLDEPSDALKQVIASGKLPDIFVRSHPSELIMIDGEPQFAAIPGTQLAYVSNTASDVFVDQAHGQLWFALVSGRWFSADSTKGPWRFVAGKDLPPDFANIPSDSPKSAVLASIPGTPEARESLIANAIPQTATVNKSTAKLSVSYDGAPQFHPIEGTSLAYAWNTAVPVIRVSDSSYYAVQNGVWFNATSATGPWTVALEVPASIYDIPPSSPLHYVTYVFVYGSHGDEVYVGYLPGYYGTVVSNDVVIYGTGYACDPWEGDIWYGCPATYGFGVSMGWTPWAGWGFGYAWGWPWASAWYGPWWGPWGYWGYYPGYYPGYWGGAIAAANVYGRWGNAVVAGRAVAWADPWTGNYGRAGRGGYYNEATGGRGAGYARRNTNIYTGRTTAAAGGIRYNPQTGRIVGAQGGAVSNAYTGNAVAGGQRTVVNTDTGRVTQQAGMAGRTDQGAGAAGAFNTQGAGGDARGAGYVHYDKATGEVSKGGVVQVNDQVYAGKDGTVYRYDKDQGWQKVDKGGEFNRVPAPDSGDTDRDRMARERSADSAASQQRQQQRQQFDRSNYNNRYQGQMGGYRQSMGGGRFGGGRGGGGFRR